MPQLLQRCAEHDSVRVTTLPVRKDQSQYVPGKLHVADESWKLNVERYCSSMAVHVGSILLIIKIKSESIQSKKEREERDKTTTSNIWKKQ